MRQDRVFKRRVKGFITETLKDAKASKKGVLGYFYPSFTSKRAFKYNETWQNLRPGHVESLFGNDEMSEIRWDNLTEVIFEQMMREFKLRRAYLLMPDKDGNFRSSQDRILNHFTDVILNKMDEREHVASQVEPANRNNEPGKSKTRAEIEEIAKRSQQNLERYGKLETVDGLRYNEQTGLIEGSVVNKMDPNGEALQVRIDPESDDLILLSNTNLGVGFVMGNNEKDLTAFANRSTQQMLNTENVPTEVYPTEVSPTEASPASTPQVEAVDQFTESTAVPPIEFTARMPGAGRVSRFPNERIERTQTRLQRGEFPIRILQSNPAFANSLREDRLPTSTTMTGQDGQRRERVEEGNLAKRENQIIEQKALEEEKKENLTEQAGSEQAQGGEEQEETRKTKKAGSIFTRIVFGTSVGAVLGIRWLLS